MLTRFEARQILFGRGIPLDKDFHSLPSSLVNEIIYAANACHYRAPRNANGSRAQYFYAYLMRRATRKES